MTNDWCDRNSWYYDSKLSIRANRVPINATEDVNILNSHYIYNIVKNGCFRQISYMDCKDLDVIINEGQIAPNTRADFYCENLKASKVNIAKNITCSHWENNTACKWSFTELSMNSGSTARLIDMSSSSLLGTGIYSKFATFDTCYLKSQFINLNNTTIIKVFDDTSDNKYIPTIKAVSGILDSCQFLTDQTTLNGNFIVHSGIINGTGNGSFVFDSGAINMATLTLNSGFFTDATNYGKIYGSPIFSGSSSINSGTIIGNSSFIDGAINCGIVSGNALFSGWAINSGIVFNNSEFTVSSINEGQVSGDSSFWYSSNNTNGIINNSTFIGSTNNGLVTGVSILASGSINNGYLFGPQCSLKSNSINLGYISGNLAELGLGCINFFTILSDVTNFSSNSMHSDGGKCKSSFINFNGNSQNNGTLISTGIISFNQSSINQKDISNYIENSITYINSALVNLNNTAINNGTIYSGILHDNSINNGNISFGKFYGKSINFGKIYETGLFYDSSSNRTTGSGEALFFNQTSSNLTGLFGYARFDNKSQNINGSGGAAQFFGTSINSGSQCNYLSCYDKSINSINSLTFYQASFTGNSINYASETGNCDYNFLGNSINFGVLSQPPSDTAKYKFYNQSINKAYVSKAYFYDSSLNDISSTGIHCSFLNNSNNNGFLETGVFFHSSSNGTNGIIFTTGSFYNGSTNLGTLRRPWKSGNNPDLTFGIRKISLNNNAENKANLINTLIYINDYAINRGNLQWYNLRPSLSIDYPVNFTSSGIFVTGINFLTKEFYSDQILNQYYIGSFYCSITNSNNYFDFSVPPSLYFKDSGINYGNCAGYFRYEFEGRFVNYGSLKTYPPIPNSHTTAIFNGATSGDGSGCVNYGAIQGGASFTKSTNYGSMSFANFNTSFNYGNLTSGPIPSTSIACNGSSVDLPSITEISFINSENNGLLNIYSIFNHSINYSTINNSGMFSNRSINFGPIGSNATFINSDNAGDIGGNLLMNNGTCIGTSIRGNAEFNSSNYFSFAFFDSAVKHPAYVDPHDLTAPEPFDYFESVSDSFDPWIFRISDNIEPEGFKGNIRTGDTISGSGIFNSSNNFGGIIRNNCDFNNSINFGSVFGSAVLHNNSINAVNGSINNVAIFSDSINFGSINNTNISLSSNYFTEHYFIEQDIPDSVPLRTFGAIFYNSINKGNVNTPALFYSSNNFYYINKESVFVDSVNEKPMEQRVNPYNGQTYEAIRTERVIYLPPFPLYPESITAYYYNEYTNTTEKTTRSKSYLLIEELGTINEKTIFVNSNNIGNINSDAILMSGSCNYGIIAGDKITDNTCPDPTYN
jgi:hypothetical protein